jgi:hypothetical protein
MFEKEFFNLLNQHSLVEIKGGETREKFLPIWMIEVNGRVFSRSWSKSEKSWFSDFEATGVGEVKFTDKVVKLKGKKLPKEDEIHDKINKAYLAKYNQPYNIKYAEGITQPEYRNYTMEFFPQ